MSQVGKRLEEIGIASFDDYAAQMRLPQQGRIIEELHRIIIKEYYDFTANAQGQFISVDLSNTHEISDLQRYMCLFPRRSLVETETLTTFHDYDYLMPEKPPMPLEPDNYIHNYFRVQQFIDTGIASMYPILTKTVHGSKTFKWAETAILASNEIVELPNVVHTAVGWPSQLNRVAAAPDTFFVAFPWLFNAHIEDYLEIAQRYPMEFETLAIAIERLALGDKDLNSAALYDLKQAIHNIQIQYEKKCHSLRIKGVTSAAGLVLTFIPLVAKSFLPELDVSLFSGIIGGSTLVGNFNLLNDFVSLAKENFDNPYWVLWKWRDKALRHEKNR